MRDLRFALRQMLRSPGFAVVAILTLALGMGANTAFFSVLYGVVLSEPPYADAARLVSIRHVRSGAVAEETIGVLARAEVRDLRERQRAFTQMAAADLGRMTLTATGEGEGFAERVKVSRVTPGLFDLLGIRAIRGRTLLETDTPDTPIAVISARLWQSHFGGAADVLSRTIRLNGVEYAIAGVMPDSLAYPEPEMTAWMPLDLRPRDASDRGDRYLFTIARLRDGVSAADAARDLQRIARDLRHDLPDAYRESTWSLGLVSLRETLFGHMRLSLGVLQGAAAFVLLIACVNVAVMSLLRAVGRRREISIRFALGAGRGHLARQLLTEAGVLCVLGALGGLVVEQVALDALRAFAPSDIPRLQEVALNAPAALITAAALIVVTLIVGLTPVAVATRLRAAEGGVPTSRMSDGRATTRLRNALTVMEVALAATLVICAALTLRSLHKLLSVDMGFATSHVVSFKTNLTPQAYPDAARAEQFYEALAARLEALPAVLDLGAVSYLPLSGEGQSMGAAPAAAASDANIIVGWEIVRGRYFETMGITLLHGRLFNPSDRATTSPVAIVDAALARRWFASEGAAIGQRMRIGSGSSAPTRTIVGVVRAVSHAGPGKPTLPTAYAPQSQVYQRGMYTVIRTATPSDALLLAVRDALAAVDPAVPMYFAASVETRYEEAVALPRFTAGLVSGFSTLSLMLAGVGIFGVTAYAVGQRTREFGIRFALGAQRRHVGALVFRQVAMLAIAGLGLGAALGFGLARLMSGLLFEVTADDPAALWVALAAIGLTALVAAMEPLRRAIGIDPAVILKAE